MIGVDGDKTCEFGQFARQTASGSSIGIGLPILTPRVRVDCEIGG